jgi:hypothetical protein
MPSCATKGFPTSANMESSFQISDVVGEVADSQIIVNLCRNAKAFGVQRLQLLYMGARRGPPDRTRVVLRRTDELHIQQNTIPDGQTASPVLEKFSVPRSFSLARHVPTR